MVAALQMGRQDRLRSRPHPANGRVDVAAVCVAVGFVRFGTVLAIELRQTWRRQSPPDRSLLHGRLGLPCPSLAESFCRAERHSLRGPEADRRCTSFRSTHSGAAPDEQHEQIRFRRSPNQSGETRTSLDRSAAGNRARCNAPGADLDPVRRCCCYADSNGPLQAAGRATQFGATADFRMLVHRLRAADARLANESHLVAHNTGANSAPRRIL